MHNHFKDFLIIDIETVSGSENIEDLSSKLKKHWDRKASFIYNKDEKFVDELYQDKAAIYSEFGKIIVIGMAVYHLLKGKPALRVTALSGEHEKTLLGEFKNLIESKFDQEKLCLCSHNGKEFDLPYLSRRMLVNDIKIPWSLNTIGKKPWEVNHVDTMDLWKFGDRKNFTSLDLLTTIFNIPSSKTGMDGSMVTKTYYEEGDGLKKIEEYCIKDVIATAQLYLRLNNFPLIDSNYIHIIKHNEQKETKK